MGKKIIIPFAIVFSFCLSSLMPAITGAETISSSLQQLSPSEKFLLQKAYPYKHWSLRTQECFSTEQPSPDVNEQVFSSSSCGPYPVGLNGPMNSSWPMKSYNGQRIGRTSTSTANTPGVVKWQFRTSWVESGAVVANNGTIYFGALNDYLFALNPNGTIQWTYQTNGDIFSVPAIAADGTIYFTSCDNKMYALTPSGSLKWRFDTGDIVSASPDIAPNGTIYIGHADGRVFAISPDGIELWHYDLGDDIYGSAALGLDGTIYIGCWDGYLYSLNPNGTLQWRFHTGNHVKGIPSVAPDGTIYFGSWDGYLYALNPNGTQKWRCHVGSGTETTPDIAQDGTIYVGGDDLYAVYPNGTLRWVFSLGGHYIFQSCPALSAEGTIYVGVDIGSDKGGEMLAVNPDGTERWRQRIADYRVESSPAIGPDGSIYIGCAYDISHGYLYAFGRGPLNADANGPYTGAMNAPLQFTPAIYGGIPPYSCHWDFGDGHTSNEQNASHTYLSLGNYTATFIVTDSEGNTSSDTAAVTIDYPLPAISITKPTKGIYFMDVRILPWFRPIIFGRITITAQASQPQYGIDHVDFYLNGDIYARDTQAPYEALWKGLGVPGKNTIKVRAFDNKGRSNETSIDVIRGIF